MGVRFCKARTLLWKAEQQMKIEHDDYEQKFIVFESEEHWSVQHRFNNWKIHVFRHKWNVFVSLKKRHKEDLTHWILHQETVLCHFTLVTSLQCCLLAASLNVVFIIILLSKHTYAPIFDWYLQAAYSERSKIDCGLLPLRQYKSIVFLTGMNAL